jgi:uridine kinase
MNIEVEEQEYKFVTPRDTVEVHLPDGQIISGPRCSPVGKFLEILDEPEAAPIVGAVVNGELRELTVPINIDAYVRPVRMDEPDGKLIYRRSLTFLLVTAFEDLYPNAQIGIDHSVSSGGYYCEVSGRPSLSLPELRQLEEHMREIVALDLPFVKREVPLSEAVSYFEKKGYHDKVRLLAHRKKDYLTLYSLDDHQDYHHGYMVPSTGYLKWFGLTPINGAFTLRFPRRNSPTNLLPMPDYPKLLATFRQYGDWLNRLGIASVGALNDAIITGRAHEIILVSEALHEQHVAEIAAEIMRRGDRVRIILVAGPSSSGKTILSKRLSIQLLSQGISPYPLEMDNYFINRQDTPLDLKGKPDFESIHALDVKRLSEDLRSLIAGEKVRIPHYNFVSGQQEEGDIVQLNPDHIIILEGIHGLNPALTTDIPSENTFRIYCSALTQLNLDLHNRISTTDTRLLRRIVRDARERGYRAKDTIQRWDSVREGEKINIFPFQENADVMFNSALAYELSALKPHAEPLLLQVPLGTPEYIETKRLLALLEWFRPLEYDLIPDNSILREFIGGSILQQFKLWHNH